MTTHDGSVIRTALGAAVVLLALFFSQSEVFAHARLVRSLPGANAALKQPPKAVELWFSEELDAGGSAAAVTDQTGRRVDRQNASLGEGDKKLQVELEDLASGTYTVDWKALSTDGHTMKGKFTFTVTLEGVAAATPPATPSSSHTAAPPTQSPQTEHQASPSEGTQESGTPWTMSLVRWLEYLAMMTLFGGLTFRLLILRPVMRGARGLGEGERAKGLAAGAGQFIKLSWWSLALLALSTLAALVLQTSAVTDTSVGEALSPARLYRVLTRTNYGGPWLFQAATILVLAVILFLLTRRAGSTASERHLASASNSGLLWAGAAVTALMMLAPSLTGHARAAATEYRFTVFSDWLHLVAAGFWLGGLFHLALTLTRGVAGLEGRQRLRVLERAIPLFTRLAIASTVVIAVTGVYNSWTHVDRLSALWGTPYGEALSVKIALFIVMVALGGLNTFVIHPRARRLLGDGGTDSSEHLRLDRSFYRSVGVEAVLGVAVLLAAAVLVFLQPVREHPANMTRDGTSDSTVMHGRR